MTTLKLLTSFLFVGLCSCGQKPVTPKVDTAAVELNNKAMTLVPFIDNEDSIRKAITLLDNATSIDSSYFLGHFNKLMFYNQLKQFDKAVVTVNRLIRLRPDAHDLYLTGGILYERVGDTTASTNYFKKSLVICNKVLDTMNASNRNYQMLVENKAINLIMLGDTLAANQILIKLYESQTNEEQKKNTQSIMHKRKKELIQLWTTNQYGH